MQFRNTHRFHAISIVHAHNNCDDVKPQQASSSVGRAPAERSEEHYSDDYDESHATSRENDDEAHTRDEVAPLVSASSQHQGVEDDACMPASSSAAPRNHPAHETAGLHEPFATRSASDNRHAGSGHGLDKPDDSDGLNKGGEQGDGDRLGGTGEVEGVDSQPPEKGGRDHVVGDISIRAGAGSSEKELLDMGGYSSDSPVGTKSSEGEE